MSIKELAKRRGLWLNLALGVGVVALLLTNVRVASAHNWWVYHWHTGRDIKVKVSGTLSSLHNAALNDWDSHSRVNFPRRSTHTEMSVFNGNYGDTGWGGLASFTPQYDWWHRWNYSKITHCHARVNTWRSRSNTINQAISCQEIGHCLGLTHSNNGCMGLGYYKPYYSAQARTVSHNWADINARF